MLGGLNLYAADAFLGSFEGLSLSGGVLALFQPTVLKWAADWLGAVG
jgi:hypothetical protein